METRACPPCHLISQHNLPRVLLIHGRSIRKCGGLGSVYFDTPIAAVHFCELYAGPYKLKGNLDRSNTYPTSVCWWAFHCFFLRYHLGSDPVASSDLLGCHRDTKS